MFVSQLIASAIFLPVVLSSVCLSVGMKQIACGSFVHPNCKFKAEYVTIKPEGTDIGFGDAYFDTHDVDVELRCSFRTPIEGNYTIAIISYEKGDFENAMERFTEWMENNHSGNGTIFAGNQGTLGKHGTIDTYATLLSINQRAGTTYTCICPDIQYDQKHVAPSLTYISASKVLPNYARSSSFYQVPIYAPCEIETCSNEKQSHLNFCYETKIGRKLSDLRSINKSKYVLELMKHCTERGIKKNWITEKWSQEWKDRFVNMSLKWGDASNVVKLRHIVSKFLVENVCSQINHASGWVSTILYNKSYWKSYSLLPELMRNNQNFPWFEPDEQEIGSLLLLDGYTTTFENTDGRPFRPRPGKDYIRCLNHKRMLHTMMKIRSHYNIGEFFTKTYPICLENHENRHRFANGETWFELYLNKVPAYYDSNHFSIGAGENILVLKTLPQNATYKSKNGQRTYKYTTVDCSLYSWKKSEGIRNYSRQQLEPNKITKESKIRRQTVNGSLVFEYRINDSIIEGFGGEYKNLVGCYVEYKLLCENQLCDGINRTEKMQFYIQPQSKLQVEPLYSTKYKRLMKCNSFDKGLIWTVEDDFNDTCACTSKLSLCNPLKTLQTVRKSMSCLDPSLTTKTTEASAEDIKGNATPTEHNHDHTMLVVGLLVMAGLMFISGIILTLVFHSRKLKRSKKEEVRVLTLITEDSTTQSGSQQQNGEFFHAEETTTSSTGNSSDKTAPSTGDGSKPMIDVDAEKNSVIDVSSINH